MSCVLSGGTGKFICPPQVKSVGLISEQHQDAVTSEVINRTKEYFSVLPKETLQNKELVEEELASIIRRLFRSELGRRPLVLCSVTLL